MKFRMEILATDNKPAHGIRVPPFTWAPRTYADRNPSRIKRQFLWDRARNAFSRQVDLLDLNHRRGCDWELSKEDMTTTHRFRIMALAAILLSLCLDMRAATTYWVQGTSSASSSVTAPYYNQTGDIWWTWTNSGSLTASKTTSQLQAVASNFDALADANGGVNGGGSKYIVESGVAEADATWNWTGSPGNATAVAIHSVQSLAKRSGAPYGSLSFAYAFAPSANTSAEAYAYTTFYGLADYLTDSVYVVQDEGFVHTEAYVSDVANTVTYSYDRGEQNASLSNDAMGVELAGPYTYSYTDYSITFNHSYSTSTGLSSIWCKAAIGYYCEAGVYFSGTAPMWGVEPGAEATSQISINGNATMDLTF